MSTQQTKCSLKLVEGGHVTGREKLALVSTVYPSVKSLGKQKSCLLEKDLKLGPGILIGIG